MANTIREKIIQNLITRAGLILIASGYNTDIGANVQWVRQNLDPDELPATVVWPGEEEATKKPYGASSQEMPVKFEGFAIFGATNPSVVSEQILGDLIKAMTSSDPTGGLADSVTYAGGGTEEYPSDKEEAVGCAATFNIVYETVKGDPYSQP